MVKIELLKNDKVKYITAAPKMSDVPEGIRQMDDLIKKENLSIEITDNCSVSDIYPNIPIF